MEGLQQLTNPEHVFKDWKAAVDAVFNAAPVDKGDLQRLFDEVSRELFEARHLSTVRSAFAKACKASFFKTFGAKGEKLLTMNMASFQKVGEGWGGGWGEDVETGRPFHLKSCEHFAGAQHNLGALQGQRRLAQA